MRVAREIPAYFEHRPRSRIVLHACAVCMYYGHSSQCSHNIRLGLRIDSHEHPSES